MQRALSELNRPKLPVLAGDQHVPSHSASDHAPRAKLSERRLHEASSALGRLTSAGEEYEWLRSVRVLGLMSTPGSYLRWLHAAGASVSSSRSLAHALAVLESGCSFELAVIEAFPEGICGAVLAEKISLVQPWCRIFIVAPDAASFLLARASRVRNASVISENLGHTDFLFSLMAGSRCTLSGLHWLVNQISRRSRLSRRQERIFWLNLWGYADREIAEALGIQLHTVRDYQLALRRRTGVRSKSGYLRLLLEHLGTPTPL